MTKAFRGKPCIYCHQNPSEDADHVLSRQFFLPTKRDSIPKVPSCKECNNKKSKLEHYLTAIMPFGGQHPDAGSTLSTMVPPRLAKNKKLHSILSNGVGYVYISENGGPWIRRMQLPFEPQHLLQLFEFVVKGLAWHHWGILFTQSHIIKTGFFTETGSKIFEQILALQSKDRIAGNLGGGAFNYEVSQSAECDELTVWRMSLYQVQVGGDPRVPFEKCTNVYAITAPKEMKSAEKFIDLLKA